ncbi:MAG: GGDEF domain-containing protein [Desulfocucumaceae bacterium]
MAELITKKLLPLAIPLGIVAAAQVFFLRAGQIPPALHPLINYSSFALFTIGLVLSYWFNRSRVFFVIVILALGQLALAVPGSGWAARHFSPGAVYSAASVLLPANLLFFSLLKERGVLTPGGRARIFFILAQALMVLWAARQGNTGIGFPDAAIFLPGMLSFTPIPKLSMLVFLITLAVLMARLLLDKTHLEAWFVGVLAALAFALHFRDHHLAAPIFFWSAGIMLVAAVIQDSYRKAYMDELTGLPGRRALGEDLAKLEGKYTIAMLDIDFFKKFNDTYGHDVGDEVLRYIAAVIRNVGGGGKAFRYGGEEFTILFPGKRLDQALPHLEELRKDIARRGFTLRGKGRPRKKPGQIRSGSGSSKKIHITVSIGVSEKRERLGTADDVVKAADSALYRAKDQGRNCVSR